MASPRVFTSPRYWLDGIARGFTRRLEETRETWVVGLGVSARVFEEVAAEYGAEEIGSPGSRWARVWNTSVATMVSLAGGAGYAEALMALAWMRGVRRILGLGLCGALDPSLDPGTILVAYASYREDGVTDHYVGPGYPAAANPLLVASLYQWLEREGYGPQLAVVVSRSSTLTESREWAEQMRRQGVACVDVETSTIYTLAHLTRIDSVVVHIVSDSLPREESILGTKQLYEEEKRLLRSILEYTRKRGAQDA